MRKLSTTNAMLKLLRETPDSFANLDFADKKTFAEVLTDVLGRVGVTPQGLVMQTLLSKSYVYQVLEGRRLPSRSALLRITLALGLGLRETQQMLSRAVKGQLYPKIRRDAALIACICKNLTLAETDEFLRAIGETPLL